MVKKSKKTKISRFDKAVVVFKKYGGMLRTVQVLREGIHPSTLYSMRDSGALEVISRGLYRLSGIPPLGNPDLITVASRVPAGVVCLISALSFHDITSQIPHEVHLALPRGTEEPRVEHPPIQTYRFSGKAYSEGIEVHQLDGIDVSVYCIEKTLADCFKFRNRIGLSTAIDALRFYCEGKKTNVKLLMHFAAICRMKNIIRPYIEVLLG